MKPLTRLLVVSLLLVVAAATMSAQEDLRRKSISSTGSASIRVEPDEAVFVLVIETKDLDLDSALVRNDSVWNTLLDLTREMNISQEQIMVDHLDIEPEYLHKTPEYDPARGKFFGKEDSQLRDFYAERHVTITLRDLSKYTVFLSRILKLGVELSYAPIMRVVSIDKHREKMRMQAADDAKEKASALAAKLGVKVGEPIMITDITDDESGSRYASRYASAMSSYGSTSSMYPGKIEISMSVYVLFEIK